MDDYIKKLKENPSVYYIYQIDFSIYGLKSENPEYIIIINDDYQLESRDNFIVYKMSTWFNMVVENVLLTWICGCIDKKYIIKEYVKITVPINVLKLRKNILDQLKYSDYQSYPELEDSTNEMIMDIIDLDLTNQIIENHKIVNLQSSSKICNNILNSKDYYLTLKLYKEALDKGLKILHKNTDELYKQDLINKANKII